jgi:tetratricopeptide (TPR) repeat protein
MKESRRRLLQQMFSLAEGALLAPQALFETTLAEQLTNHSSQLDDAIFAHLETITRNHWHLFLRAASKGDLLSSFWGHLQTVLQLLNHASSGAMRNRLYSLVSESAQMIGEILFDMQDYHHAQMYYHFSIYAAKEAGNNALRAVGLGRMSFLPIYRDEPLQARPLLEEAKQLLASVPRPILCSWLAVVEAEVMAHLHDDMACEKALEQAIEHYHHEASEEDLLWTRLNDATIPGYKGACYLRLQQPQKALASLQETFAFIPGYSPRHQSLIITDMAAALLQMNEIEETCRLLHQVLEATTQTKSLLILTRMQQVRKNLEHWKDTSYVQQLDRSVAEVLPSIMV